MELGLGISSSIVESTNNMVIRRRGNTVVLEVFAGLLDDYTSGLVGWWGLKKRFTTYLGNCIRVRRASDNQEANIPFNNETGWLDETAIADHCGVSNGFVTAIYDQSGNQRTLRNGVASKQFQIYNGSAVVNVDNLPYILGDAFQSDITFAYTYDDETLTSLGFGSTGATFKLTALVVGMHGTYNAVDGLLGIKDGTSGINFNAQHISWGSSSGLRRNLNTPLSDTEANALVCRIVDYTLLGQSGTSAVSFYYNGTTEGANSSNVNNTTNLLDPTSINSVTIGIGIPTPPGTGSSKQKFVEGGLWHTNSGIDLAGYSALYEDLEL